MADNYLEKRMADYQAGKTAQKSKTRVVYRRQPLLADREIFVDDGLSHLGSALVSALRAEGARVAFSGDDPRRGASLAQQTGAQYLPPTATGRAAEYLPVLISPEEIHVGSNRLLTPRLTENEISRAVIFLASGVEGLTISK